MHSDLQKSLIEKTCGVCFHSVRQTVLAAIRDHGQSAVEKAVTELKDTHPQLLVAFEQVTADKGTLAA